MSHFKGISLGFDASDFTTSAGGPGYYTPFDDSISGWTYAALFSEWVHLNHDPTIPRRSGFHKANIYARQHRDLFIAWYATLRLGVE